MAIGQLRWRPTTRSGEIRHPSTVFLEAEQSEERGRPGSPPLSSAPAFQREWPGKDMGQGGGGELRGPRM